MLNAKYFAFVKTYIKILKGAGYDKIYEVSSTLRNGNFKMNKFLNGNYKGMLEVPDFE